MTKKATYKRLGDYIRQVDVRNKDLAVNTLVGLTIDKAFIPSVANTIGTDLSNYKVISKGQFACSLMQVSRDGRMPVAMYTGEKAIMSPAYPMFEVTQPELMPEFLMMWFSRSEFDRQAAFYAVGGVRGSLTWEDFCDFDIPVPPIDEQRKIVAEYQAIERRIENNRRLIATLEATAQTIYRHMFVDNIDPEHLPDGWRMGTIGEYGTIITGKTPSSSCTEDYGNKMSFITPGEFKDDEIFTAETIRKLSDDGITKLSKKILPSNSIAVTCIGSDMGKVRLCQESCISNQQINTLVTNTPTDIPYVFFTLRRMHDYFQRIALGSSTMPMISKSEFEKIEIIHPNPAEVGVFATKCNPLLATISCKQKENNALLRLINLFLTKLSKL